MARFNIISKDGKSVRYSGKPRYNGSYLKPSFLEFSEIASASPIAWEVGDYVDYPRTGMRYYLYSIPQASKNARKGTSGRAFTYSNVQFYASTKDLDIALFRDIVPNDNGVHFSTSPDVSTYENVYGIADRIQACLDDQYPGKWLIQMASFNSSSDTEILEEISTEKEFALSGGTCLDALSKIYDLWQNIGWVHSYEGGMEVITIGYANKRIDANTTDPFLYGKGNGLTAIRKNQTNREEFATRLYVYGSDRNLPSRYYNGLSILNSESVDIRNLMLPIDAWGLTDGLPDASKAYIENADMVEKYGVVPKIHYFDSIESGADIFPSIEGVTIGQIREVLADMGQSEYYPNTEIYSGSERVDEIISASNPTDDGEIRKDGKRFETSISAEVDQSESAVTIPEKSTTAVTPPEIIAFGVTISKQGMGELSISPSSNFIVVGEDIDSVKAVFTFGDSYSDKYRTTAMIKSVEGVQMSSNTNYWQIPIPSMGFKKNRDTYSSFPAYLVVNITITPLSGEEREFRIIPPIDPIVVNFERLLTKTFEISLKQVGFDISEQASIGEGKVISMRSGSCEGRNFIISDCKYEESTDSWNLVCQRQQDDTLGLLFPNSSYGISGGDRFVLFNLAMPELYIRTAMERLLSEGNKFLARASKIQCHYDPAIDAKAMIESGRTLREGMFMEISDTDVIDGTTEYILIDTLSIYEDESAIPTYKVTLRERRKVTYKGTPSSTSTTTTKGVEVSDDIDLSNYATKEDLSSLSEFKDWFYKTEDGAIGTKYNFFSEKAISAGGTAEEGESGGETYKMYTHYQDTPSKEWVIEHGLGKMPNVKIVDRDTSDLVFGDVVYNDTSLVTVKFGAAFSGIAYLD